MRGDDLSRGDSRLRIIVNGQVLHRSHRKQRLRSFAQLEQDRSKGSECFSVRSGSDHDESHGVGDDCRTSLTLGGDSIDERLKDFSSPRGQWYVDLRYCAVMIWGDLRARARRVSYRVRLFTRGRRSTLLLVPACQIAEEKKHDGSTPKDESIGGIEFECHVLEFGGEFGDRPLELKKDETQSSVTGDQEDERGVAAHGVDDDVSLGGSNVGLFHLRSHEIG